MTGSHRRKPASTGGAGVRYVIPGVKPDTSGDWTTLYFKPGVHNVGPAFQIEGGKNYYIPGDAIVYGSFNSDPRTVAKKADDEKKNLKPKSGAGRNSRIFGHGTLSGARLTHPKYRADVQEGDRHLSNPIEVFGAENVTVDGITIADAAHHSLML